MVYVAKRSKENAGQVAKWLYLTADGSWGAVEDGVLIFEADSISQKMFDLILDDPEEAFRQLLVDSEPRSLETIKKGN